jgi:hypothetical protein
LLLKIKKNLKAPKSLDPIVLADIPAMEHLSTLVAPQTS